jgi:hypothetical protein
MISISCSTLEQVRKNHAAFVESLSIGEKVQRGGTHGMFAYWQDTAKKFHLGELDINEGIKELQSMFSRFEDTKKNLVKQSGLMNQFVKYTKSHRVEKFTFFESRRRITWNIIPEIRLTGLTPWTFKREDKYYAYFCIEKNMEWQLELKFPLLQKYMSNHIVKCDLNELSMGIYCLEKGTFEFKCYSALEVRKALSETKKMFENVNSEYIKRLELAGR